MCVPQVQQFDLADSLSDPLSEHLNNPNHPSYFDIPRLSARNGNDDGNALLQRVCAAGWRDPTEANRPGVIAPTPCADPAPAAGTHAHARGGDCLLAASATGLRAACADPSRHSHEIPRYDPESPGSSDNPSDPSQTGGGNGHRVSDPHHPPPPLPLSSHLNIGPVGGESTADRNSVSGLFKSGGCSSDVGRYYDYELEKVEYQNV